MAGFDDYKKMARERGSLAHEVFVAMSSPVPGKDFAPHLPDHLAYIARQEAAGVLMMAGPMSDEAGAEMSGSGLQIWRASDMDAARALVEADPMHVAGVKTFVLRRWLINEGSLSLTVGLSAGAVSLG